MGRRRSAYRRLAARPRPARRAQRGAYAVEFAFTFLALFAVAYAGTALAVAFAGNQLLTLAAEDGARAALRAGSEAARRAEACRVAHARSSMFSGACDARIDSTGPACAMSALAGGACLRVTVTAASPIPQVPLFGAILPTQLAGQATVRLESAGAGVLP